MALIKAGRQAKTRGHHILALERFTESARIDPKNAFAWANLGSLHAEEGKLEDSIKAFQKAIKLDPTHQGFAAQLKSLEEMKKRGIKLPRIEDAQVEKMCGSCHAFPDPQILPRETWANVLASMHDIQGGFADIDPRAHPAVVSVAFATTSTDSGSSCRRRN